MSSYLGDFASGATVQFLWGTNAADGSSITRATDGAIRVYKDASATQRSSSAGITDTEDFDSLTGIHLCAIDLSDNTDAGFYATGHNYTVVLAGATIDGKSVNSVLAYFSISNRVTATVSGTVDANVVKWTGTNVASPDTAGYPKVTLKSGTGTGEVSLASGVAAASLSSSERNAAADALLNRATSSITESAAPKKSLYAAIAKLTHKVDSAAGTMTTYRSDGTTPHFTQAEATDAAADPLTGLDGAA